MTSGRKTKQRRAKKPIVSTKATPWGEGVPYTMLSPYPGLDKPVSLQTWGHQLKLDNTDDERLDQFISSLLRNPNTYPEVGASCENTQFLSNPAPFVAEKPGPDAVPVNGRPESESAAPTPSVGP